MDQNLPKSYKVNIHWVNGRVDSYDAVSHSWLDNKRELLYVMTAKDESKFIRVEGTNEITLDSNWHLLAAAHAKAQELKEKQHA